MAKPIAIRIEGTYADGRDAPTVDDLLCQVQDLVFILHEVEGAIAQDGSQELVWLVTNATKSSPITLEVTPVPSTFGMNVDLRAANVVGATARGLHGLRESSEPPMYFNDAAIASAERVSTRVTNGLATTTIDCSEYIGEPSVELTPDVALQTKTNIEKLKSPKPITYRELGSVEGYIARVELDGYGRPLVWIRTRLDNELVKCISQNRGLDRIGHLEVSEVLKGLRVLVHGIIHYKDLAKIKEVHAEGVQVFPPDNELPDSDSIVSPNFTAGVEASAYLKTLREDG